MEGREAYRNAPPDSESLVDFVGLVRAHQAAVRSFLWRMCGNRADADDLAQETFVAAWSQLSTYRQEGSIRAWLCGIAYRKMLGAARSDARRRRREQSQGEDAYEPAAPPSEARLDLEAALLELDDVQRAVVALCWSQDFSHGEAAAALGLPIGTVKSHLTRARTRLRAVLEQSYGRD